MDGDVQVWRAAIVSQGWERQMTQDMFAQPLTPYYSRLWSWRKFDDQITHSDTQKLQLKSGTSPYRHTSITRHPYKELCVHYFTVRNNWFKGNCKSCSFQAHSTQVVTCLHLDNHQLISGSDDHSILLFKFAQPETGRQTGRNGPWLTKVLHGHDGGVWCLQVIGRLKNVIVSGSTDRTVRVWNSDSGDCLNVLRGHTSTIRCLYIIPDNQHIPEPDSGHHNPPTQVSSTSIPLNSKMVWVSHQLFVSMLRLNFSTSAAFIDLLVTEVGYWMEVESFLIVTGSRDRTLSIWRLELFHVPENLRQQFDTHMPSPSVNPSHFNMPSLQTGSRPTPKRASAVTGIQSMDALERKLREERLLRSIETEGSTGLIPRDWKNKVTRLLGKLGGGSVSTGTDIPQIESIENEDHNPSDDSNDSDSDDDLQSPRFSGLNLQYLTRATPLHTMTGHTDSVRSISVNQQIIVSGSYDFTVRVWRMQSQNRSKLVHILTGHTNKVYSVACDELGNRACSGSMDATVRVWDVLTGSCLHLLEGHSSLVGLLQLERLLYLPPSAFSRYRMDDNSVMMGSPSPPQLALRTPVGTMFPDNVLPCNQVTSRRDSLTVARRTVPETDYAPGHPILISAAADSTLRIWNVEGGSHINTLYGHTAAITCLTFDSDKCVSGSEGAYKLWDLRRGGAFVRDLAGGSENVVNNDDNLVANMNAQEQITGAWKIAMDDRRCVMALQRGGMTWFEIMDYDVESAALEREHF